MNCIVDQKNKIKIPQNQFKDFIIVASKDWKNSIDIKFDIKEDINILNLFLIIKSYIKNVEFFCYKIATVILKKNNDLIVTENLMLNWFNNMSYWEFENWLAQKIISESKYLTDENDLLAIRISFQRQLIEGCNKKYKINNILEYLKHLYPWKLSILKEFKFDNFTSTNKIENIINIAKWIKCWNNKRNRKHSKKQIKHPLYKNDD